MKKLLSIMLTLCMVIPMMCACSSTSSTSAESSGDQADTERPIKDEIIFAQGSDITSLDPHKGFQERAYTLTNNMYDPLLTMDANMQVAPCLATSWEWSEDQCHLTMHLRQGVKFHNGEEFTSEDAAFTIDLLQTEQNTFGEGYLGCDTPDDYTIVVNFSSPMPSCVNVLTDPLVSMMPKDTYEADPEGFATNPVGTGPYKLKDYSTGDYYTLECFDEYWGEPAKTQYITMKIVPESGQRVTLLQTGEIDVAYDIPYNSVSTVQSADDLQLLQTPSVKIIMLYLDCKDDQPWKDPKVRQAIAYAIDKESIVQAVTYGYGTPTYDIMPSNLTDYRPITDYSYDVEKAKQLMAEAGYADGFAMACWCNSAQANTELATILQNQLKEIGITLNIDIQDDNTITARGTAGDPFGIRIHFFSNNIGHADYVLNWTLRTGSPTNYGRFSSAEYDELHARWKGTGESTARDELTDKLFAVYSENMPMIPVYQDVKLIGATANLEGLFLSQMGAHEYQNAVVYTD